MFGRFLGSSVSPMSLTFTEADRLAWDKYWTNVITPAGDETVPGLEEEQRNLIGKYLDDHPNSVAYSVFYSRFDDATRTLPYKDTGDQAIFDEYLTGVRNVLSPTEYARKVQVMDSYRFYLSAQNKELQDIVGQDVDLSSPEAAASLLRDGYKRTVAIAKNQGDFQRYLALNPEAAGEYKRDRAALLRYYNIPVKTFQAERLSQTVSLLNQASDFFTGESGMRLEEVRAVLSQLKQLYATTGEFGEPRTESEKATGKYFDDYLDDYFLETGPLYEQINKRTALGQNASDLWMQLSVINRKYTDNPFKYKGVTFPTPEEMFFGNKNPSEQKNAVLHWTIQPPQYQSPFRRDKVGYARFEGDEDFIAKWQEIDQGFYTAMNAAGYEPGDRQYDYAETAKNYDLLALARPYGPEAENLLGLSQAPPVIRLQESGYGQDNANWTQMQELATYVNQLLISKGYSPAGWSQLAEAYKMQVFQGVINARASDPEFDKLWTALSYSVPDKGLTQKEGIALYDAVLFGNSSTQYIPSSILNAEVA